MASVIRLVMPMPATYRLHQMTPPGYPLRVACKADYETRAPMTTTNCKLDDIVDHAVTAVRDLQSKTADERRAWLKALKSNTETNDTVIERG